MGGGRGQIHLPDVVTSLYVLIALLALAPFFYTFIGFVDGTVDPFSSLLLQLSVPLLFVALLISMGVSAR